MSTDDKTDAPLQVVTEEARARLAAPATWTEPKHRPKSRRELRAQIGRINDANRIHTKRQELRQQFDRVSEHDRVQATPEDLHRRAEGLGEPERIALMAKGIESREEAFERGVALIERTIADQREQRKRTVELEVSERGFERNSKGGRKSGESRRGDIQAVNRDASIRRLLAKGKTATEIATEITNPSTGERYTIAHVRKLVRKLRS